VNGLFRAIVRDTRDPQAEGKIKVQIPAISGESITDWVYPLINAGYIVKPAVGSQVWIAFEAGDVDFPVWLGSTKQNAAYATLVERVVSLEEQVADIQSRLSAHDI